jgi:hypothetical protein
MSRIFVSGYGAVSPAGWSAAEMQKVLADGKPLPVQPLERPGWEKPLRMRAVPAPAVRPAFLAHPRLRRSSPITHYAAGAMLEALKNLKPDSARRIGLIVCLQSGCVQYTHRFFEEALADPATASPLLFPETVFAAPASHLAALLENTPLVSTLMGDPATFAQGLALGADWLRQNRVDVAVVVGTEEINWLRADALWHLEHAAIISAGAGAVALCREAESSCGAELCAITKPQSYSARKSRTQAARAMREAFGPIENELLCDGLGDSPRTDAPEIAAWQNWPGRRLSPKTILGEGLVAAAAWQCVAACAAVAEKKFPSAIASLVGCNQQAAGVRFQACSGADKSDKL